MGWVNLDESLGGSTTLKSRLWGCWATRTGIGGEEPIMNINNERVEIGSESKSYHKPLHFRSLLEDHKISQAMGFWMILGMRRPLFQDLSRRWWSLSQYFFHDQARWSPKKNPSPKSNGFTKSTAIRWEIYGHRRMDSKGTGLQTIAGLKKLA